MSEKVTFLRSTAFENLAVAAFLFVLYYILQDIDSLSDWSSKWSGGNIIVGGWVVKFFWLCGKRVCTGRWHEEKKWGGKWRNAYTWGFAILILGIVIVFRPKILGPRETIDGVTWRYVVKDGKAVIEHSKRNFFNNRPAISVTYDA